MEPFTTHTGTAVALRRSDVDTDQIIPSDWLKRVERTGFGAGLFSEWREDPSFVLNRPEHAGASVLVAGNNFGTGSSREHAVWALTDFGFEQVLFETVSAFATVGMSTGITPQLPPAAQGVVIALMFIGRLGPLTLASGLALRDHARRHQLPEERTIVG